MHGERNKNYINSDLLKKIYFYICVCASMYTHVWMWGRKQEEWLDLLELELQEIGTTWWGCWEVNSSPQETVFFFFF